MTIQSFRALRPGHEYARAVAALPYDVMNTEEARAEAEGNPFSFLHVDKAEIDLPSDIDPYSPLVYAKAKENLQGLMDNNILVQDDKPNLYIYQLAAYGRIQRGLAACVSVEEYKQGLIKRHEFTRPVKENDRINHMKACCAHTGPIFMAYRDSGQRTLMDKWVKGHEAAYDFISDDGVQHSLWVIDNTAAQAELIEAFGSLPYFYIADGHHRNEAALKVGYPFYLAVLFPHDELAILDYNRVVADLNGLEADSFLTAVKMKGKVEESPSPVKPLRKHEVGMYLKKQWYRITLQRRSGIIESMDVSILQNDILSPILGIDNPKTDPRIDFVGGIRGLPELERRVDSGEMAVAFAMYPTSMEELMAVADADQIMPPKSTWFEPKLRSGLLIHKFVPDVVRKFKLTEVM